MIHSRKILLAFVAVIGAAGLCGLTGCASSSTPKPYEEKWSNIPQNRPQAWEGNALGAFMPGSN